jgi:hypothetical protein
MHEIHDVMQKSYQSRTFMSWGGRFARAAGVVKGGFTTPDKREIAVAIPNSPEAELGTISENSNRRLGRFFVKLT